MDKIWKINAYQEAEFKIDSLLLERGIKSEKEKKIYFDSNLNDLSDPFLLADMQKAVSRIKRAIKNKEKILIYGDYDVDGITSTALLYRFFKESYNYKLEYFLPDRIENGYGLNINSLQKLAAQDIDLIITVDCGITAFKEASFLAEENIDLIITDHHTPLKKLPQAVAVINHHLVKNEDYFAKDMAGVGTAFKLIQALNEDQTQKMRAQLLPLVALGTVADIAPLRNENRILVKNGLKKIAENDILGLKILIKKLKIDQTTITAGQIGFIIAPPLNAAGRIADAEQALKLLITENFAQAEKIAAKLIKINKDRQKQEEIIYKEAERKITNLDLESEKAIILADENWHSGIIGIVASKLLEKYHLPVILFALDNKKNLAKGSARSISALNIYEALKLSADKLLSYGGHRSAAGLTIETKKIDEFRSEFSENIGRILTKEDFLPKNIIDLNLNLEQLNKNFIKKLEDFRPFGIANPAPKFILRNLKSKSCYQIGSKNKHLKLYLENGIQALAFNFGDKINQIKNSKIDVIAQAEINNWKGRENIQLNIKDFRLKNEISTPLVFENKDYVFYDYRNSAENYSDLKFLLSKAVIKKAAVYVHNKKLKKELVADFKKHYFFGSDFDFQTEYTHLIIYSLPFSLQQLKSIIEEFNSRAVTAKKRIIFLFNQKDAQYNQCLIKHKTSTPTKALAENELDFEGSIRYNKLSRRMEKFKNFKNLIFKENLFDLMKKLTNFEEEKNES